MWLNDLAGCWTLRENYCGLLQSIALLVYPVLPGVASVSP